MAEKRDIVIYKVCGTDLDKGVPTLCDWPSHRGHYTKIIAFKHGASSLAYFMRAWARKNVSADDADLIFSNNRGYSEFYKKDNPGDRYFIAPAGRFTHAAWGIDFTVTGTYLRSEPTTDMLLDDAHEGGFYVDPDGCWPELAGVLAESNGRRAAKLASWKKEDPDGTARKEAREEKMLARRDAWKRLHPDPAENVRLEIESREISYYASWTPQKVAEQKALSEAGNKYSQYEGYLEFAKKENTWQKWVDAVAAEIPLG